MPMTSDDRRVAEAIVAHIRHRMSVWEFGKGPLLLGGGLLLLALVLFIFNYTAITSLFRSATNTSPASASTFMQVLIIALGLMLVAGVGAIGYGVVRIVLGQLAAGRGNPMMQQSLTLIQAELAAGQAELSTHTLSACCLLSDPRLQQTRLGGPAGYLCQTSGGYLALLDEGVSFGSAARAQPALPATLGTTLTIAVLPRSRRTLRIESAGTILVPLAVLPVDELPDFARGSQLLREDHLTDEQLAPFLRAASMQQGQAHAQR
jgi:hypothetical protein